jgi:hypothetical protein
LLGKLKIVGRIKSIGYFGKATGVVLTGLLHEDHNDLNNTILNDRHIYDVAV